MRQQRSPLLFCVVPLLTKLPAFLVSAGDESSPNKQQKLIKETYMQHHQVYERGALRSSSNDSTIFVCSVV